MSSEDPNWGVIRIRQALLDEITRILKTNNLKKEGMTNPAQFVDNVIRAELALHKKKRFEHLNIQDNIIRLIDNNQPKYQNMVEIVVKYQKLHCNLDETTDCVHIDAVWGFNDFRDRLIKLGLKPPKNLTN